MANKFEIPLESPTGLILQTENKYCDRVIVVKPKLQSKTVTASSGTVRADEGYCGLLEVIIGDGTAQALTVAETVSVSGTSGEFSSDENDQIQGGATILVDGLAFAPIGESGEVKCFAACEISDELATVKVLKKTGTAWAITTFEV